MEGADPGQSIVAISALQHYVYCPRQCALIHVEQVWAESESTAQGRILHERADERSVRRRDGVRVSRALALRSERLGIAGRADVVEFFMRGEDEVVFPVEYKRGRPKKKDCDRVQLCAQALCLEEMFGVSVQEGALYYGKTRRRENVVFGEALRAATCETIDAVRGLIESGGTPAALYNAKLCDACSLIEMCRPREVGGAPAVQAWVRRMLEEGEGDE